MPNSRYKDSFDQKILEFISKYEAGGLNYDVLYSQYKEKPKKKLTDMTINEVYELQSDMTSKTGSSPVGAFQFVNGTLREEVELMGLSNDEKFTPEIQERLILQRLKRMRGYDDFKTGKSTQEEFLHHLSKEFASMPDPKNNGKSHYDGVLNNKAGIKLKDAYDELKNIRGTSAQETDLMDTPEFKKYKIPDEIFSKGQAGKLLAINQHYRNHKRDIQNNSELTDAQKGAEMDNLNRVMYHQGQMNVINKLIESENRAIQRREEEFKNSRSVVDEQRELMSIHQVLSGDGIKRPGVFSYEGGIMYDEALDRYSIRYSDMDDHHQRVFKKLYERGDSGVKVLRNNRGGIKGFYLEKPFFHHLNNLYDKHVKNPEQYKIKEIKSQAGFLFSDRAGKIKHNQFKDLSADDLTAERITENMEEFDTLPLIEYNPDWDISQKGTLDFNDTPDEENIEGSIEEFGVEQDELPDSEELREEKVTDPDDISALRDYLSTVGEELEESFQYNPDDYKDEIPLTEILSSSFTALMGANLAQTDLPYRDDLVGDAIMSYVSDLKRISQQGLSPAEESMRKKMLTDSYSASLDAYSRNANGNRNILLGNLGSLDSSRVDALMKMALDDEQRKLSAFESYGRAMEGIDAHRLEKENHNYGIDFGIAESEINTGSELMANSLGKLISDINHYRENRPGSANHAYKESLLFSLTDISPGIKDQDDETKVGTYAHKKKQVEDLRAMAAQSRQLQASLGEFDEDKRIIAKRIYDLQLPWEKQSELLSSLAAYDNQGQELNPDADISVFAKNNDVRELFNPIASYEQAETPNSVGITRRGLQGLNFMEESDPIDFSKQLSEDNDMSWLDEVKGDLQSNLTSKIFNYQMPSMNSLLGSQNPEVLSKELDSYGHDEDGNIQSGEALIGSNTNTGLPELNRETPSEVLSETANEYQSRVNDLLKTQQSQFDLIDEVMATNQRLMEENDPNFSKFTQQKQQNKI